MRTEIILQKLYNYSEKLIGYCRDYTYESFTADTKLVEACVFNLSQMGELCRIADSTFMEEHPEIPWREMNGLRNRIVHNYEGVNLQLAWEILSGDISELRDTLDNMLYLDTGNSPQRGCFLYLSEFRFFAVL